MPSRLTLLSLLHWACVCFVVLSLTRLATGHPLSEGALEVTIHPDRIVVQTRITAEEVSVTNSMTGSNPLPGPWAASGAGAFEQHARYLVEHLQIMVDGIRWQGSVSWTEPPPDPPLPQSAIYGLVYRPANATGAPRHVVLQSTVLTDAHAGPKWQATYLVKIGLAGQKPVDGLLLTSDKPVSFDAAPATAVAPTDSGSVSASDSGVSLSRLFKDFFVHGVHHILTGYDHLLFISALVLGARSLWDLIKVVTAFTLAHMITLTLAALNLVHLSERIVEPMIAASIVFVAMQNVFAPKQSRGVVRLAAAFAFGLFHGLGFAGGLLEVMQGMRGTTIVTAILAFSLGVEAGHQMVVLPLFAVLRAIRAAQPTELREQRFASGAQRFGSAAISLAGIFYLLIALGLKV